MRWQRLPKLTVSIVSWCMQVKSLHHKGFPGDSVVKNPPANAGGARDEGLIPGLRRFPWNRKWDPFQNSCLENSMDRGGWRATYSSWGRKESDTRACILRATLMRYYCNIRNGNPLQWSCLENPRDRGAWWAAISGVAQSRTRLKWLSSSSSRYRYFRLTLGKKNALLFAKTY